jgi:hypothetical protein
MMRFAFSRDPNRLAPRQSRHTLTRAYRPAVSISSCSEALQRKSDCACGGGCPSCAEKETGHAIQTKLTVSTPGDHYEQEADRVADQIMRMPDTMVQRQCESCANGSDVGDIAERSLSIQRYAHSKDETGAVAAEFTNRLGPGVPLDSATRDYFEPRFGHDFSSVRIHHDAPAAAAAADVQARAFTLGRDVVFGAGEHNPGTDSGRRLLAHELTHVVQQRSGPETAGKASGLLQRSPTETSIWGGFSIEGDHAFIESIREMLDFLNGTVQGGALLKEITANRSGMLTQYLRIEPHRFCAFFPRTWPAPDSLYFNTSSCSISSCPDGSSAWSSVPQYVYLFHEIVHAYLYYIAGKGTDLDKECMTTGLGSYFTSIAYNENRLRCELGLPVRPCYGGECRRFPAPTCPAPAGSPSPER